MKFIAHFFKKRKESAIFSLPLNKREWFPTLPTSTPSRPRTWKIKLLCFFSTSPSFFLLLWALWWHDQRLELAPVQSPQQISPRVIKFVQGNNLKDSITRVTCMCVHTRYMCRNTNTACMSTHMCVCTRMHRCICTHCIFTCVHLCVYATIFYLYKYIWQSIYMPQSIFFSFVSGYSAARAETQNGSGMHILQVHVSLLKSKARRSGAAMAAPPSRGPTCHLSFCFRDLSVCFCCFWGKPGFLLMV